METGGGDGDREDKMIAEMFETPETGGKGKIEYAEQRHRRRAW